MRSISSETRGPRGRLSAHVGVVRGGGVHALRRADRYGSSGVTTSRFWLSYRLETIGDVRIPRAAAHEYGGVLEPIDFDILPGRSVLSTLRASIEHDTRDHPWLPTRGWLASAAWR